MSVSIRVPLTLPSSLIRIFFPISFELFDSRICARATGDPPLYALSISSKKNSNSSLLSIGSAAGVALMGQARGYYTFFGHLKWTPVIFLGYIASIYVHLLLTGLSL